MSLRSRSFATTALLALGAALAAVGCSSDKASTATPTSDAGAQTALLGSFVSMPAADGSVTRLSFRSDGTYVQASYPCNSTQGTCIERGTFTASAALDSLELTSAAGTTSTFPLSVLDRDNDDANNGDDDDAGSGSTTTQDLVTSGGDASVSGDDGGGDDDDDGGGVVLVNAGLGAIKSVQQFVLLGTGGSKLFTHESPVENQKQTENCWIYSTMGWADALANYATPTKVHEYSEAYIYYWEIYEQLTNTGIQLVSGHGSLNQGGFWGRATWLATRYGMMVKGTFVSNEEASAAMNATVAINKSLKSGALKKAASRRNHALVRSELDKAFGLSSTMTQTLNTDFGSAVTKNFTTGATRATGDSIFRPADIIAELTQGYQALSTGRLNSAIGLPDFSGADANTGNFAWSGALYPQVAGGPGAYATRFDTERRIIGALNDGFPVPIIWYADSDSYRPDGTFQKAGDQSTPMGTSYASDGGYHLSLIADYEVDTVPGFGTIAAGTTRTQAQKDAAMQTGTQVRFFRIKNTWGTTDQQAPGNGYNDLYMTYLDGTVHVCDAKGANCNDQAAFYQLDLPPGY